MFNTIKIIFCINVCCSVQDGIKMNFLSSEPTAAAASEQTIIIINAVGEKAKQKCREFEKYDYSSRVISPISSPDTGGTIPLIPLNAVAQEFPHVALIGFDKNENKTTWACSGSLISEQFVLTAAHCLHSQQWGSPKYIRLGEIDYKNNSDNIYIQNFINIESIKHPDYKPPSLYNDIALLKLNHPVRKNFYVRPACLQTNFEILPERVIEAGWGKITFKDIDEGHMLKTYLDIESHQNCSDSYNFTNRKLKVGINNITQLCAHSTQRICQGNSGGPLQIYTRDHCMISIIGVASFGRGCFSNAPLVYTRVSHYIEWIENTIWP